MALDPDERALLDQVAEQVAELWALAGLDAANPMTVTPTGRTVGDIALAFSGDGINTTTVTRVLPAQVWDDPALAWDDVTVTWDS